MSGSAFFGNGPLPDWTDVIRLDDNHAYALYTTFEGTEKVGALVFHRREDGNWCGGGVRWDAPREGDEVRWTLHSLDPLHVEPSVKCSSCAEEYGDNGVSHGFIRNGEWVPAGEIPEWAR